MKKLLVLCLLLVAAGTTLAQKQINDPNAALRNVGSFTGISVSAGIDLFLSPGDEAVAVSASTTEARDRIRTEVENGVLKIYYDPKSGIKINWNSNRNLRAYVSFKTLKSLSASGGCDVVVDGVIKTSELRMDLSGGSDFKGKVDVENLRINQSGGCDVTVSGRAGTLSVDASGGSDFNGFELSADICDLDASGGSDVEVTANKELSARASGASDIRYKGQPNVKEGRASGASSVKARG